MNYGQARQREKDGQPVELWDWTNVRDHVARRSAPCNEGCAHKSAREAARHFYDYCLETAKAHPHSDEQRKCEICDAWTDTAMGNTQMSLAIRPVELCEQHRTQEYLAQARPFPVDGVISIIHS